ncbi:MAG: DASS family sodium-coupled anion symporter [Gammaproteobacteria bacterium]
MSTTTAMPPARRRLLRLATLVFGLVVWFAPVPEGLTQEAWQLFAIFITTIFAVIINAMPILTASVLALAASILTGTLEPAEAYSGFGSGFILLIVIAFLIGRAVVNSGLGARIAYALIRLFGKTTLGLGYSMVATDILISPAFPSNTARSGVLYPIVYSLSNSANSRPDDTRRKMGAYLMMNSMAGLSISSALWLTAMAANPTGAAIAGDMGIEITFLSWLIAASVPCLVAFLLVPYLLYRVFPPETKDTPEAPREAARQLAEMGPLSRKEWITAITFVGMVVSWGLSKQLGTDNTAIAFLGLAVLLLADIFTTEDMKSSGDALSTLIWFAALYTLSSYLNKLGFMSFLGERLGAGLEGLSWPVVYVSIVTLYVLIHYLFVSQTAQMLALFGVFVGVAVQAGVPPTLIAMMLLFATNFFSVITPQGSSANVIFASSGYLTQGEVYRTGAIVTFANLLIFMIIGTPWILMVTN